MNQPLEFTKAYISFGANLPFQRKSPAQTILKAMQALDHYDLQLVTASSLWSSPAWPDPSMPEFCNAVALYMSHLSPLRLMNQLGKCEITFGRKRDVRNAPRTLDVDLISYGEVLSNTRRVKIPHPRVHERPFVLLPLQQIAPDWICPLSNRALGELLVDLDPEQMAETKLLNLV